MILKNDIINSMKSNFDLVNYIRSKKALFPNSGLISQSVLDSMLMIDRKEFIPRGFKSMAYYDEVVPIGFNQTCSQPSLVAFMIDVLDLHHGNKVLEIGAGCGYASAVISNIIGSAGILYSCEIIPELAVVLEKNLSGYKNIKIISGDGSSGFEEYAPFDKILLSAGVSKAFNPALLVSQLSKNGTLEFPERFGSIYVIKKQKNKMSTEKYFGVSFVPLTGKNI